MTTKFCVRILISSVVIDTECIKIATAFWKQVSPFHSFSHINYGLVEPNTLYHVYAVIVCLHAWMARLYCQNSICQIECQHSKMIAKAPIQSSNLFNRECHFLVAIRHFSNWLDTFQIDQFPSFPSAPPSFNRSIYRPVILCSRTAQKRLLRRLTFMRILIMLTRLHYQLRFGKWACFSVN